MTKEAVNKLAGLIRDKDLEIEALKGRNEGLVALVHEKKPEPVEEKESTDAGSEKEDLEEMRGLKDTVNQLSKEKQVWPTSFKELNNN